MLKANDKEKTEQFEVYATQRAEMREELDVLRQQVDVYSRDFQLERTAREEMAGEKAQLLDDLRSLQRKNHELSELVGKLEERITSITRQRNSPPTTASRVSSCDIYIYNFKCTKNQKNRNIIYRISFRKHQLHLHLNPNTYVQYAQLTVHL